MAPYDDGDVRLVVSGENGLMRLAQMIDAIKDYEESMGHYPHDMIIPWNWPVFGEHLAHIRVWRSKLMLRGGVFCGEKMDDVMEMAAAER